MTDLAKLKPLADWMGELYIEANLRRDGRPFMFRKWIAEERYRWRALALIRKVRRQRNMALTRVKELEKLCNTQQ